MSSSFRCRWAEGGPGGRLKTWGRLWRAWGSVAPAAAGQRLAPFARGDEVDLGDGEGEGPGLATRAFAVSAATRAPRERVRRIAAPVQRLQQERRVDGRFGRCRGCDQVLVFCGPCASVAARCGDCADARRREAHRRANRAYARTTQGVASNRARQARRRRRMALNRRPVTDTISTEAPAPPTPPSPSSSEVEPTRDTEVPLHESPNRSEDRCAIAGEASRCARCGRVLSGRVRPSEWTPPRRGLRQRKRAPRPPRRRWR